MKSFDLKAITKDIYSAYPEAARKPLIGITANYTDGDASLRDRYYTQIADAGDTAHQSQKQIKRENKQLCLFCGFGPAEP